MTHTLSGVIVPDNLYTDAKAHAAGSGTPLLAIFGQYPGCANCGGAGQIGLYLLSGKGSPYPGWKPPRRFHDGLWYDSELKSYPCPICQIQAGREISDSCFAGSGLEKVEYGWRVSFAAGWAGKESAMDALNSMLADTARPTGWIFLHGDNGLGKSGFLKSAVAAMCAIGVVAHYTTAARLLNEVYDLIARNRRGDEAETMKELIVRYSRYQLLSVDEIGTDRMADTQFAQSALFGVLDNRYSARERVATLLASNQTPQALAADSRWRYFESRTRDGIRLAVGGQSLRGLSRSAPAQ